MILDKDFYARNACIVARELLGTRLVHQVDGATLSGIIVETEAYTGLDDLASHGRAGQTSRNLPMWEEPGHAYVYLVYGMYWLLNVVCEPSDQPAAVLIRAIEPETGLDIMQANRPKVRQPQWTNGPAKLTLALGIDSRHNRLNMTDPTSGLWLETSKPIPDEQVTTGPRIGLGKQVPEPWLSIHRRWWIVDNRYVSC